MHGLNDLWPQARIEGIYMSNLQVCVEVNVAEVLWAVLAICVYFN